MELIQLMEQGLGLDAAHSGIFTELGVLYSKYVPAKLMEHIKIFWSRMNTPKLMRACEKALLWDEAVFLLKEDEQYDSARISARGVPAELQNSRARSHRCRFG